MRSFTGVIGVLLLLGGCGAQDAPRHDAAKPAPTTAAAVTSTPSVTVSPRTPGIVSIQGDDTLADVLSWTLPEVHITDPARARREARSALRAGDLFETAHSAIPLLLALSRAQPQQTQNAQLLVEAQDALLAQARSALQASDDPASLRYAQRMGTVLRSLWPQRVDVQAFLADVDRAGQAFDLAQSAERALRAGRLTGTGSALALYRAALAQWPVLERARTGIVAVESALITRAIADARDGEFAAAYAELTRAEHVRPGAGVVTTARARVERIRADRVRQLRDLGLMALADESGLSFARERLADILRIAKPGEAASVALRRRIDLVNHYGVFRPGQVFTDPLADGGRGPELAVLPYGSFQMGAPDGEPGASADEQPQHPVHFARGFAMSRHEITVAEFRRFVEATGYVPRATQRGHSMAYDVRSGNFVRGSHIDWRSGFDGRPAAPNLPVIHITARDAEAYADWLSKQTNAHYRLPSEAEFEYALRAGTESIYPWGLGSPRAVIENLAGARDASPRGRHWSNAFEGYADGFWGPAPVGSFAPNRFHLYDMGGNVSEWVADCWHRGYRRAPATGAAWVNPGCRMRMVRGGAWSSAPVQTRAAWRASGGIDVTNARVGFRLVRQL